MHFYYFLYIFRHISQISRAFSFVSRIFRFTLSLLRVSSPHMPTVGSGALLLSSRTASSLTQKYSDDDYDSSRRRGRSFARPCRARDEGDNKRWRHYLVIATFNPLIPLHPFRLSSISSTPLPCSL